MVRTNWKWLEQTTALEEGEGSASRPGRTFSPRKSRYSLYRRLGGPQGRYGQVRKISPSPGFDPPTIQPIASRYTDYTTRPTEKLHICLKSGKNTGHCTWRTKCLYIVDSSRKYFVDWQQCKGNQLLNFTGKKREHFYIADSYV